METIRKSFTGSCHCGDVKYIATLTLPKDPMADFPDKPPATQSRIYKCNCTPCHKMGFFHVRLVDAPNDFAMLDPPLEGNPLGRLGDYTCNRNVVHWYFCRNCGVRMFALVAEGEVAEIVVSGEKRRVWKLRADGYEEGKGNYFSLNATTLDHGQEGLDLRSWHENGWMRYSDDWKRTGGTKRLPYPGGMY